MLIKKKKLLFYNLSQFIDKNDLPLLTLLYYYLSITFIYSI